MDLAMLCNQCEMSAPGGCGSSGAEKGTCGKDSTLARLQDMMIYGLKGLAAYRSQAHQLGADTSNVDKVTAETLYFTLTNVNFDFDRHIKQLMAVGTAGVEVMGLLADAHHNKLGVPTPVTVTQNKAEGKGILVSGHDLKMLKELLEQTEGKGINVYTHSEMLPAHAYPELKKFSHLKGNIGKAWFDQKALFEKWQGAIVVNTNCIVIPRSDASYCDRLFTTSQVGVSQGKHIEGNDYSEVIKTALACDDIQGFDSEDTLTTGHNYKTILSLAPQILEAINSGKITKFIVMAGCDAPGKGRDYYREMAKQLPETTVIITSSCGKFRFNDLDFGNVPGTEIPRYLDLGQCNDSNGAVQIALALSEATGIAVNDLPIAISLMWMEQKAVLILFALLSLGIQNIYIGPKPPQFVNEAIFNFLVENFNLHLISTVEEDLPKLIG